MKNFHCLANSHGRNNSIANLLVDKELTPDLAAITNCITQFYNVYSESMTFEHPGWII